MAFVGGQIPPLGELVGDVVDGRQNADHREEEHHGVAAIAGAASGEGFLHFLGREVGIDRQQQNARAQAAFDQRGRAVIDHITTEGDQRRDDCQP